MIAPDRPPRLCAPLAGVHALQNVPLDAIPDVGDTQVIVYSRWDRSPDVIEAHVTYPIVTAMLGAPLVRGPRTSEGGVEHDGSGDEPNSGGV